MKNMHLAWKKNPKNLCFTIWMLPLCQCLSVYVVKYRWWSWIVYALYCISETRNMNHSRVTTQHGVSFLCLFAMYRPNRCLSQNPNNWPIECIRQESIRNDTPSELKQIRHCCNSCFFRRVTRTMWYWLCLFISDCLNRVITIKLLRNVTDTR